MYRVFISYAREHAELPGVAKSLLDAKQIPAWIDETLKTGAPLLPSLREALEKCEACLFFATPESLRSEWCRFETVAFWALKKPILTHLGASTRLDDLPGYLREGLVRDNLNIILGEIVKWKPIEEQPPRPDTLTEDKLFVMLREILGPLTVDRQLDDRALSLRGLLNKIRARESGPSNPQAVEHRLSAYLGLPVGAIQRAFASTWDKAFFDEGESVPRASFDNGRHVVRFLIREGICVGVGVADTVASGDDLIASVGAFKSTFEEERVRHA